MFELFVRTLILFGVAVIFYFTIFSVSGVIPGLDMYNTEYFYTFHPIMMALVPIIVARLPIMGTRQIVESGMNQLFSSTVLIFFAYIGYLITESEQGKGTPMGKWLCANRPGCSEDTEIYSGVKINNKSLFILCFVFGVELFVQLLWLYYTEREKALKMTKAISNALKNKSNK